MGIFSRLSDIVNSNIVHMLDRAEDPEKMVRLMIQEMEDTLVEVKASAARVIADRKTIERKRDQVARDQQMWEQRAILAVQNDRDDLARAALEEKKAREKARDEYESQIETIASRVIEFREDIAKLEDKLEDAKQKQKAIIARRNTAASQLEIRDRLHQAESSSAFQKFEQMERQLDRMEGEVELFRPPRQNPLDTEFTQLESKSEIDGELAQLKQKLGSGQPPRKSGDNLQPEDQNSTKTPQAVKGKK